MPKPHKSRAVVRRHVFNVRFSDLELEIVRFKARSTGLTMTELVRRNSLLRPLPQRLSKVGLDTYRELGRIGNNLNQLTKVANTAIKMGQTPPASPAVLASLAKLLNEVRRELACINDDSDDFNSEEEDDWQTD